MNYLIFNCILIIVIIIFAYFNSLQSIENFTPKIREFYRPIVRNTRVYGKGFYDKTTSNITNLFRKFGIM